MGTWAHGGPRLENPWPQLGEQLGSRGGGYKTVAADGRSRKDAPGCPPWTWSGRHMQQHSAVHTADSMRQRPPEGPLVLDWPSLAAHNSRTAFPHSVPHTTRRPGRSEVPPPPPPPARPGRPLHVSPRCRARAARVPPPRQHRVPHSPIAPQPPKPTGIGSGPIT